MTYCYIFCRKTLYRGSSVAEAVRDVLESDWLLFRMLQSGVANLTALADEIKPNVENHLGAPVSTNTVIAALTRQSRILQGEGRLVEDDNLPLGVRLSLSDQVSELETEIKDARELTTLYEKLRNFAYIPFGLYFSSNKCRFYIDNNSSQKDADQELPGEIKSENRFTKIKVDFPSQLVPVPNILIYEISTMLYKSHIDVHSAFFTPSGVVLVVENDNAAKLYEMLYERLKVD